ncbi:cytochrome c [Phenylobacterium sp.]|uniref:c-type cytochrome n=1 Tax=Phenylobacterium sp. TaxID=1871053 RepID=UPI002617612E|nr:cytochrome c [Phenylobacterium sp.]
MSRRGLTAAFAGLALAGLVAAAALHPGPARSQAAPAPAEPQLVARGAYLTAAGDCQACHTAPGGQPFAGGLPVKTPFGTIVSANITPGGIGDWTPDQFYRALHQGVDDEGKHLYPAFPYNYYTLLTRADSDAIFAYLKTLPASSNHPNRDQLPFPFNIRFFVRFWNMLFLKEGPFQPNPGKSAEWNRGAYLVEALGHCQACHTPSNFLGGPKRGQAFRGGAFPGWFAPDLTPNRRTGLGSWSRADLIEFLKTGRNAHAQASGEMGEVVADSTSHLTDADLDAIATYVTDRPASPAVQVKAPEPAVMRQGEAIFVDSCSACHRMDGRGTPRFFPPLVGDANLQQRDPTTILRFIEGGVATTPTPSAPTPLAMPAYGWKLTDDQVAAVATFVRNSWGNAAPPVSVGQAAKVRKALTFGPGPTGAAQQHGRLAHPGPETWSTPNTMSSDNGGANAGRAAPAGSGAGNGGSSQGHPAGVTAGGPG